MAGFDSEGLRGEILELFENATSPSGHVVDPGELSPAAFLRTLELTDAELLEDARREASRAKAAGLVRAPWRQRPGPRRKKKAPKPRPRTGFEQWFHAIDGLAQRGHSICRACGAQAPDHRCPVRISA